MPNSSHNFVITIVTQNEASIILYYNMCYHAYVLKILSYLMHCSGASYTDFLFAHFFLLFVNISFHTRKFWQPEPN